MAKQNLSEDQFTGILYELSRHGIIEEDALEQDDSSGRCALFENVARAFNREPSEEAKRLFGIDGGDPG